jgi:hypothetical protein
MAESVGASRNTVARALLAFRDLGMVAFRSPLGETGPRIVKVLNYNKYQDDDSDTWDRGSARGSANQKNIRSKEVKKKKTAAPSRGAEVKQAIAMALAVTGWMGRGLDDFDRQFIGRAVKAGADPVETAAKVWVGMSLCGLKSATQSLSKANQSKFLNVQRELEAAKRELAERGVVGGGRGAVPGNDGEAEVASPWVPPVECDIAAMQRAVHDIGGPTWDVQDHIGI